MVVVAKPNISSGHDCTAVDWQGLDHFHRAFVTTAIDEGIGDLADVLLESFRSPWRECRSAATNLAYPAVSRVRVNSICLSHDTSDQYEMVQSSD